MATNWEMFPVQCSGGLVTNISDIQQGINAPGSARRLVNFEPSIDGGYRRINGYGQYDDEFVPPRPTAYVKSSGGTSNIVIDNLDSTLTVGSTFIINGNTYEVSVVNSYDSSAWVGDFDTTATIDAGDRTAGQLVTFPNDTSLIQGLFFYEGETIAKRGRSMYKGTGTGWTKISVPTYGTPLVDGGAQTGNNLVVDGFDRPPEVGDTFTIGGIANVTFVITSTGSFGTTSGTIGIAPALPSSPADNAVITFLDADLTATGKTRHLDVGYLNTPTMVFVDGTNLAHIYDGTNFYPISDTGLTEAAIISPAHVSEFKASVFLAKDNTIAFTAPYTLDDFSPASGGGIITTEDNSITGMIVFRDQLIIFCSNSIYRLTGNSSADFQLLPITKDIGCVAPDTIQEVGGDILFLSSDGIRFLSASERIGDFSFALASRPVQGDMTTFLDAFTQFHSLVVREKSQYRIFGYKDTSVQSTADGWIGTQFADQTGQGISWGKTRGIFAYVAHSESAAPATGNVELILFANNDGLVYQMETGSTFDGTDIAAEYWTPYLPINDPRVRKTIHKVTSFISPEGLFNGRFQLEFDFNDPGTLQPAVIQFDNSLSGGSNWGTGVYGTMLWGGNLQTKYIRLTEGSGFNVSVKYTFTSGAPFQIDVIGIEFVTNTRQ